MKIKTLVRLLFSGQLGLALRLEKISNEFYRASFLSTALSEGLYASLSNGPATIDQLFEGCDTGFSRQGLEAWLKMGVSLGELQHDARGYRLKSALSRKLAKDANDAYQALLQEVVEHHYSYILRTPSVLRSRKRFPFDESTGRLIARSSRIAEPLILEAVDKAIPTKGSLRLLEVGCGSGAYIRHACRRNPALTAVGLELQAEVAEFARGNIKEWSMEDRVTIHACDVREYPAEPMFDLVTLHQNIYYFSVEERVDLARHLKKLLKPGGKLLITSLCQGRSPMTQALNIWVCTTEGHGPLPMPEQLCEQLRKAGFSDVSSRSLIPSQSFFSFNARRPLEEQRQQGV